MPEIEIIPKSEDEKDEQEQEGISQEVVERVVAAFEAKIDSGDWSGKAFHAVVKEELYPLIGEGVLELEQFTRLVQKWSYQNHPFDWPVRDHVFGESPAK